MPAPAGLPPRGRLILRANKSGRLNCITQSAAAAASAGGLGCFDRLQMLHLRRDAAAPQQLIAAETVNGGGTMTTGVSGGAEGGRGGGC